MKFFKQNENFDRNVYIIDDNKVVKRQLRELCTEYADVTTTPHGVCARYHLRGCELWDWGYSGNNPKLIESFETQGEADHALLLCHLHDLHDGDNNPIVYGTKAEADNALVEMLQQVDE